MLQDFLVWPASHPRGEEIVGGLVGSMAVARLFAFQREDLVMDILTVAASFISSCTLPCQFLPLQLDE